MNVVIIETATQKVIATVPMTLSGQNYVPTDEEYINEAWRCAVEDHLVKATSRDAYRFEIQFRAKR